MSRLTFSSAVVLFVSTLSHGQTQASARLSPDDGRNDAFLRIVAFQDGKDDKLEAEGKDRTESRTFYQRKAGIPEVLGPEIHRVAGNYVRSVEAITAKFNQARAAYRAEHPDPRTRPVITPYAQEANAEQAALLKASVEDLHRRLGDIYFQQLERYLQGHLLPGPRPARGATPSSTVAPPAAGAPRTSGGGVQ
jgi:hypothetical protein